MANFAPKRNATYVSGTTFLTLLSFLFLLLQTVRVGTYTDVIIKFSQMDRRPNFLGNGAPLARALRARGAPLKTALFSNQYTNFIELLHHYFPASKRQVYTAAFLCQKAHAVWKPYYVFNKQRINVPMNALELHKNATTKRLRITTKYLSRGSRLF